MSSLVCCNRSDMIIKVSAPSFSPLLSFSSWMETYHVLSRVVSCISLVTTQSRGRGGGHRGGETSADTPPHTAAHQVEGGGVIQILDLYII